MKTATKNSTPAATSNSINEFVDVDLVWDGDGGCVPANPKRVCRSHDEAKAKCIAIAREYAGGWKERKKGWVNWWRSVVNDPVAYPFLLAAVEQAPENDRTSVGRLLQYLNLMASMTSWDAKDPVFVKRETLAEQMGCTIGVVSRCAKAAERAGVVTQGVQQRWVETEQDGYENDRFSSTVRMLSMRGALGAARQRIKEEKKLRKQRRAAEQAEKVEQQALQRKREAAAAHEARLEENSKKAQSRKRDPMPPDVVAKGKAELAKMRRQLLE